jgi:hypothetical protein
MNKTTTQLHSWKKKKYYHLANPSTRAMTMNACDNATAAWWLFEQLHPGLAANFASLPLVQLTGPEAGLQIASKTWYDRGTAEAVMAAVLGLPFPYADRSQRETADTAVQASNVDTVIA